MRYLALVIGNPDEPATYPVLVPNQIRNLMNNNSIQSIVSFVIISIFVAVILLSFFFIMFGGIKWITSQGDKKQLEGAQKTIQYAIVGLILALLSFFIINFIGFTFGVHLLGN